MANIVLDVDGAFAEFQLKCASLYGAAWRHMSDEELWQNLEKEYHLFATLKMIPDSTRIVTHLLHPSLGHKVSFLTALPRPTGRLITADQDKRDWLAKNISKRIPVHTVVGGKNKYKFITSPNDVLVDDYRRNIDGWINAGGIGILHTSIDDTLDKLDDMGLL